MKFMSLAVATFSFALSTFALTASYDTRYDDGSYSLTNVACSNGVNGLITKGYSTLGSLPDFPYAGGTYTVTGWNSPACGTCYEVTYGSKSIYVLAIDVGSDGFNLSEAALNELTGGLAVELGRVTVTSVQVPASKCGLKV